MQKINISTNPKLDTKEKIEEIQNTEKENICILFMEILFQILAATVSAVGKSNLSPGTSLNRTTSSIIYTIIIVIVIMIMISVITIVIISIIIIIIISAITINIKVMSVLFTIFFLRSFLIMSLQYVY